MPSINHYYRRVGNKILISREGREFRQAVMRLLAGSRGDFCRDAKLALMLDAFPPDRRRRDLDNLLKPSLDALEHAEIFENDGDIDLLVVRRNIIVPDGMLSVELQRLPLRKCLLCGREF